MLQTMKLAMIIAAGSLASIVASATPVFACPAHESAAPKTAEKAPAKDEKAAPEKKEAPKTTEPKDTAKAAPTTKDTAKKPADKVSQK